MQSNRGLDGLTFVHVACSFPPNVKTRMSFPIVLSEGCNAAVALHEVGALSKFAGI